MARMTKEELREDPVLESIQKTVAFGRTHGRWILAGVFVIAVVIIGAVTLDRSHRRGEREAAELLLEAQRNQVQGQPAAAEVQLRRLLDSHARSAAAKVGRIYLGDALMALDRPADALDAYEKAADQVGDDPLLEAGALRGKASALEALNRPAEASQGYEQAANKESPLRSDDLLNAGRTALAAGDPVRAEQLLERAKEDQTGENRAEIEFYLAQAAAKRAQNS